jgi:hypothetical protein
VWLERSSGLGRGKILVMGTLARETEPESIRKGNWGKGEGGSWNRFGEVKCNWGGIARVLYTREISPARRHNFPAAQDIHILSRFTLPFSSPVIRSIRSAIGDVNMLFLVSPPRV